MLRILGSTRKLCNGYIRREVLRARGISLFGLVALLGGAVFLPTAGEAQDATKDLSGEIVRSAEVSAGLCVHLGVTDGVVTADLVRGGNFVVHGLALNPAAVHQARRHIHAQGLYGRVSVEQGSLARLPYADNLVNLVIVDDFPALLNRDLSLAEVMRVLRPEGVAYVGQTGAGALSEQELKAKLSAAGLKDFDIVNRLGTWARIRKPASARTDGWEQWMYGPGHNLVSADTAVGPGKQVQWIEGPMWGGGQGPDSPRHLGFVSTAGRTFYGERDWRAAEGTKTSWYLIARDAYNGFQLWRRPVGDSFAAETIAAVGNRVYTVVDGKLSSLNSATGETVLVYEQAPRPALIAVLEGKLVVLGALHKDLTVLDLNTGRLLWKDDCKLAPTVRWPPTDGAPFVAGDGKVFCKQRGNLVGLDLATGKVAWQLPTQGLPNSEGKQGVQINQYAHGLLLAVNAEGQKSSVYAISGKDGKHLWTHEFAVAMATIHLLSYPQEIWAVALTRTRANHPAVILNPRTGEERERVREFSRQRCSAPRGCGDFVFTGNSQVFDRKSSRYQGSLGLRSTCSEGEIPANGLTYFLPVTCQCAGSIRGVLAIAPAAEPAATTGPGTTYVLEQGEARPPKEAAAAAEEWPSYRYGPQRGNATAVKVPDELAKLWECKVGTGKTSPLTVAAGLVFVCDVEGFQVCAIDGVDGKERWRYTTGSRVAIPPTVHQGLCLFGAHDGWVYCVEAKTGQLIWRRQAGPTGRRMMTLGRLESPWPVVSGVLVQNGVAYFCAGRYAAADGGIHVHAVEIATGKSLWVKNLQTTGKADLLVGDGTAVYMSGIKFDPHDGAHDILKIKGHPPGILGVGCGIAKTTQRYDGRISLGHLLWSHELRELESTNGALTDGASGMQGSVIAFNDRATYACGFGYQVLDQHAGYGYMLGGRGPQTWSTKLTLRFTALALAGNKLFGAGVPSDRGAGKKPELWVIAAADGKALQTIPLDARPTSDGLAVAYGKVFLSTEDGRIICLGKK